MAIAFFDFDGTLTCKDTFLMFARRFRTRRQIVLAILKCIPIMIMWKLHLCSNGKAKQSLFSALYNGISIEEFDRWGHEFITEIDKVLNPQCIEILKKHLAAGDKVYIVSASISNWITPWAQKKGCSGAIATEPMVSDTGKLTGKFATPNCYGNEKVTRIKEVIPDIANYMTYSYGNSKSDYAMFKLTNHSKFIH